MAAAVSSMPPIPHPLLSSSIKGPPRIFSPAFFIPKKPPNGGVTTIKSFGGFKFPQNGKPPVCKLSKLSLSDEQSDEKSDIPKLESVSSSDDENESDSDEEASVSSSDSPSSSSSDSSSDSEDDIDPSAEGSDMRVPLKRPENDLEEFEPPNEFGVRLKTIIKCDGLCEPGEKCVCKTTPGRGAKIHSALKPYQPAVIDWMIEREAKPIAGILGGMCSLHMGLGKTLISLVVVMRAYASANPPEFPTLVICPLTAIYTWKEQIDMFFGSSCPYLIVRREIIGNDAVDNLTLAEIKRYKVIITNYETIRAVAKKNNLYEDLFELDQFDRRIGINSTSPPSQRMMARRGDIMLFNVPWARVILDESQVICNPKSAVFYSIMCLYSRRKWCLTGTPILNYSTDVFSQFRFLGFDGVLIPKQFTLRLYSDNNLDKCILYMTKEDAGIQLPELTTITVPITLEQKEQEMYDHLVNATKEAYDGFLAGCVCFANVLTLFLRLRQCCISAYTITEESSRGYVAGGKSKENFTVAQQALDRMTSGLASWIADKYGTAGIKSSKVREVMNIIKNKVPKGEKVIVFTSFKKLIDVMELAIQTEMPGTGYEIIDGDVTGDARDAALNRFKNGPAKVLFISYKIGSTSLNLIEATHVILTETVWSPATLKQASARAHRVGQEKAVTIWQLVTTNTIEHKMLDICLKKQELFEEFITKKKNKEVKMDADMLRRLLS
jgi:SNF2 family DNA or RNA helicase